MSFEYICKEEAEIHPTDTGKRLYFDCDYEMFITLPEWFLDEGAEWLMGELNAAAQYGHRRGAADAQQKVLGALGVPPALGYSLDRIGERLSRLEEG